MGQALAPVNRWVVRAAIETLHMWVELEADHHPWPWQHLAGPRIEELSAAWGITPENALRNLSALPIWDMSLRDWETFVDDMDRAYTEHKAAYRARIERAFAEAGAVEAKTYRAIEHMDWLAWYQVGGLTYNEIAQSVSDTLPDTVKKDGETAQAIEASAVQKAVHKWADILKLDLR